MRYGHDRYVMETIGQRPASQMTLVVKAVTIERRGSRRRTKVATGNKQGPGVFGEKRGMYQLALCDRRMKQSESAQCKNAGSASFGWGGLEGSLARRHSREVMRCSASTGQEAVPRTSVALASHKPGKTRRTHLPAG